jgi:hypothetical protein
MCRWLTAVVFSLCFSFSAFSQATAIPVDMPIPPLSRVRQYLGLTGDQVNAILQNNNAYNSFSFQQQGQILQAQSQIAIETAKDTLDPMAIGVQYANIETICRGLRAMAASSQQQNISVLTDAQMVKLNALSDAMKLIPTISEAQSGNLLGSANATTFAFTTTSSFSSAFFGFSSVAGCSVNSVPTGILQGDFGGILNPSPVVPAP